MREPYEIYLSPKTGEVLEAMVELAHKHQVQTARYLTFGDTDSASAYQLMVGGDTKLIRGVQEDVVLILEIAGLVIHQIDTQTIYLTTGAIEWHQYRQRKPISRWWYRVRKRNGRFIMVGVSILATILATSLAISLSALQIIEALQKIGYLPVSP